MPPPDTTAARVAMHFAEVVQSLPRSGTNDRLWLECNRKAIAAALSSHGLRELVHAIEDLLVESDEYGLDKEGERAMRTYAAIKVLEERLTALLAEPPTVKGEK